MPSFFRRTPAIVVALAATVLLSLAMTPSHGSGPPAGVAIYGGTPASEAPWEAYVLIQTDSGVASCTGAVIGQRWILTAAHCLTHTEGPNAGGFFTSLAALVVTGHADVSGSFAELQPANGQGFYIAEEWNPAATGFIGDVALIRLDRDVTDPGLGIVPARPDSAGVFAPGHVGTVSGWGLTESGAASAKLLGVGAPIRPPEDCAKYASAGFLDAAIICSGDDGPPPRGTCRGDSGGVLFAASDHGPPIAGGVTSFGAPDCSEQPSGFSRVAPYAGVLAGTMAADPVAPVVAPELVGGDVAATSETAAVASVTVDANGAATNVEIDLSPTLPAAPLRRGTRGGVGDDPRDLGFALAGLAPGVTYNWNAYASGVFGRAAGPSGQFATPGTIQPLAATAETTRCGPEPEAAPPKKASEITLSRVSLAINQRIGQAALKRLNAIEGWLNAGIVAADLCGGGLDGDALSAIELGRAGTGPVAPAPAPRPLKIDKLAPQDLSKFSMTSGQLRTNQRIYQAALRRARALRQRLNGGLTGGDVRDGALGWEVLPPGAMMTSFGPGVALGPSKTAIAQPKRGTGGAVSLTATQLKINQRIAQAAVREANALRDDIESGLSRRHFRPDSISAVDFTPAIAEWIAGAQPASTSAVQASSPSARAVAPTISAAGAVAARNPFQIARSSPQTRFGSANARSSKGQLHAVTEPSPRVLAAKPKSDSTSARRSAGVPVVPGTSDPAARPNS